MASASAPAPLPPDLSLLDSCPLAAISDPHSHPTMSPEPEAVAPPPPPAGTSSPSSDERWKPDPSPRRTRFPRACTSRPSRRLLPPPDPRPSPAAKKEREERRQNARIVTPLAPPQPSSPSLLPRWELRSMWELASILNFLHVFRPLANIELEVSAEELETALITPNSTLEDIHIPLLKAIPPVIRMALGRATWITVLCRKLKNWWHWVAEGDIPIVASHGVEVETYKSLDPRTRVLILKALCDIRVEQEDIRSYMDNSLKHGIQLSTFRRERIGGDSHGISFWYEDDPILGHRLYREIRHVEVTKMKAKGSQSLPPISHQWETIATNLDEFQEVSDKLFSSKNRMEAALGKRLMIDILPEIEKIHKKKEKLLKKQHRQALLLDSFLNTDGISAGRALRDRKPVTYTFDDYDRSISEAIKITKKRHASPDQAVRREAVVKPNVLTNGKSGSPPHISQHVSDVSESLESNNEEMDAEHHPEPLDRSNRRRKKPQRYSEKEFVQAVPDDVDFDSDDDIVGEAVYDEEYLRSRKRRKMSSSSDGDEEYRWEDENADDEEEDEESLSISEDIEEPRQVRKPPSRSRRGTKMRSVGELQSGLRRSRRSAGPRVNYQQYELSESDADSAKRAKFNPSNGHSDARGDLEMPSSSQESQNKDVGGKLKHHDLNQDIVEAKLEQPQSVQKMNSPEEDGNTVRRRFLDLNELAPGTGFEEGSSTKDNSQ
ncbi:hypothetical protein J5N97_027392 [Dioscorea zingiberensis]|uniref:WHIM1 domain-containing protein n=1 Tax=Dioscorea zingiberensis TaxID=325984 RepID=A0A9D5C588_9LILI|nr:hypothetical protein J5N97_027392 [Dioscorea zingiberensis]